eukprot:Nk52_evm78s554 gene=Nk52_evmTU78s554
MDKSTKSFGLQEASTSDSKTAKKDESRLFVANIPHSVTRNQLIKLFANIGEVKSLEYPMHKEGRNKGRPRGFCFLEFVDLNNGPKAISKFNGKKLSGRELSISFSVEKERPAYPQGSRVTDSRYNDSSATEALNPTLTKIASDYSQMKKASAADKLLAIEEKLKSMKKNK